MDLANLHYRLPGPALRTHEAPGHLDHSPSPDQPAGLADQLQNFFTREETRG